VLSIAVALQHACELRKAEAAAAAAAESAAAGAEQSGGSGVRQEGMRPSEVQAPR
jgi:hypothetical protein